MRPSKRCQEFRRIGYFSSLVHLAAAISECTQCLQTQYRYGTVNSCSRDNYVSCFTCCSIDAMPSSVALDTISMIDRGRRCECCDIFRNFSQKLLGPEALCGCSDGNRLLSDPITNCDPWL